MNKILVVDDDTDLLVWMKLFLLKKGYAVRTTTTCSEAAALMESFEPDLVLLDINVGSDDGRETCKQIKSIAKFEAIPIILISADHQLLSTYQHYNATGIIEKPFVSGTLLEKIGQYMVA